MAECAGCCHHDSPYARRSLRCRLGIHWHWNRDMRVGSDPFLNKCVECEYEWAYKGSYLSLKSQRLPFWIAGRMYNIRWWWRRQRQAAWMKRRKSQFCQRCASGPLRKMFR